MRAHFGGRFTRPRRNAVVDFAVGWRDSMRTDPWRTGGVTLVVLGLLFALTECTVGVTNAHPAEVLGHEYHPPYTTRSCDDDGCITTHHPAEWHLVVDCGGAVHSFNAGPLAYYRIKDGQRIIVAHRDGRWTGTHYLHWVRNEHAEAEAW